MADIELVIKMSKRVYNYIRKYEHIANSDVLDIKDAIINGKPLPEGMIDANKVQEKIDKLLKEPDYQHEGEDWRAGLIMAEELVNDAFATIESEE